MSVHITEINVQDLGPIKERRIELGPFNLIYGKNERGKTFVVELLITSLFKSASSWKLRGTPGAGKVEVAGLDKNRIVFSPTSHAKLEDFLEERIVGMPPNLSKLLVVKGAELSMAENKPGGINRAVLKEFLSSEALLDTIESKIERTIRGAAIVDGEIEGAKAGDIKRRRETKENIDRIDGLIKEIDALYSGGKRALLKKQLEETIRSMRQMELAKKHRAYCLQQEIKDIEKRKGELTRETLDALRESLTTYRGTMERINDNKRKIDHFKQASDNYDWLRHAIDEYKEKTMERLTHGRKGFMIAAMLGLMIAGASLVAIMVGMVGVKIGASIGIVFLLSSGLFGLLHLRAEREVSQSAFDAHEISKIADEYNDRFGEPLKSIASMEARKEKLYADYVTRQNLEGEVNRDKESVLAVELKIHDTLKRFGMDAQAKERWSVQIAELDGNLRECEEQINDKKSELLALDVDQSDYVETDPGVKYQKSVLEGLRANFGKLEAELRDESAKLENLKQSICRETGDEFSIDWENLIDNLRGKREEQVKDYRRLTSELLAKILIKNQLELLRQQEDEKIQASLNSNAISSPLKEITHRYERVRLVGDSLVISDPFQEFPLESLSTGAQEQVLLALRIGCAARIVGKEGLFLILDDAFQHADWDRRGWLLDQVIKLANQGWQIIYLTMDDHIRDLFDKVGHRNFKKNYRFIDLEAEVS